MKILKKYELGWDILRFRIGRFRFRWFTDCGEWFVYFIWNAKKYSRCVRLSGAGCYNKVRPNTKEE